MDDHHVVRAQVLLVSRLYGQRLARPVATGVAVARHDPPSPSQRSLLIAASGADGEAMASEEALKNNALIDGLDAAGADSPRASRPAAARASSMTTSQMAVSHRALARSVDKGLDAVL